MGRPKKKLSKKVKKPLKLGFLSRKASGKKAKAKKSKMKNDGISVAVTRDDTPILKQRLKKQQTSESVSQCWQSNIRLDLYSSKALRSANSKGRGHCISIPLHQVVSKHRKIRSRL